MLKRGLGLHTSAEGKVLSLRWKLNNKTPYSNEALRCENHFEDRLKTERCNRGIAISLSEICHRFFLFLSAFGI